MLCTSRQIESGHVQQIHGCGALTLEWVAKQEQQKEVWWGLQRPWWFKMLIVAWENMNGPLLSDGYSTMRQPPDKPEFLSIVVLMK